MVSENKKQNFVDKILDVLSAAAEKLQGMTFLVSISDAMQATFPVTMVGAFACMFAFLGFDWYQAFLQSHPFIYTLFMKIQSSTLTIISLYVCWTLTYVYSKKIGVKQDIQTATLGLGAFLLLTPITLYSNIPMQWLGHAGLFSAFVVGWAVPQIVKFFVSHNITIKMPAGVPKIVEDSFTVMFPGLVVGFGFGLIGYACQQTSFGSFHNILYTLIQEPLKDVGNSLPVYLLYHWMMTLAMWCGIHGSSVGSWRTPIATIAKEQNLAAFQAGLPLPNIIAGSFESCCIIGGIGSTLGTCICLLLFCKSKRFKVLSRIAIVPQLFNINEPVLFGIPIMLNPVLLVPYLWCITWNTCTTYIATKTGLIGGWTGVTVGSWTLGVFLAPWLGNERPLSGFLMQQFNLWTDVLFWYPFLKRLDNEELRKEKEAEEKEAQKKLAEAAQ